MLLLFPPDWRREHGRAYAAALAEVPVSPELVLDVARSAMRVRRAGLVPSRLRPAQAGVLGAVSLVLIGGFLAAWTELYRMPVARDPQWSLALAVAAGFALVGVTLTHRHRRGMGGATLTAAVLSAASQWGLVVPDWRSWQLPLQVCCVWFLGLSCWCMWVAVGGARGLRETLSAG